MKLSDCWSWDMLKFDLRRGLGLVSPRQFVHDFLRKIFIIFYCLIAFTSWDIWQYIHIVTICYPVSNVLKFEIYLSFLIKPISYITKNSEQKLKYLNKKSFQGERKSIFHHFQKTFSCQKLSQNWECALNKGLEMFHKKGGFDKKGTEKNKSGQGRGLNLKETMICKTS